MAHAKNRVGRGTEVLYSVFSKIESSMLDTRCSSGSALKFQESTRFLRDCRRTNENVIMTEDVKEDSSEALRACERRNHSGSKESIVPFVIIDDLSIRRNRRHAVQSSFSSFVSFGGGDGFAGESALSPNSSVDDIALARQRYLDDSFPIKSDYVRVGGYK